MYFSLHIKIIMDYNVYAVYSYGNKFMFGIGVMDPGAVPGASTNKERVLCWIPAYAGMTS